jgi:tetratricopeptide (TPR) repeat protein
MEIERAKVPIAEEPISTADALYELSIFLGKMEDTRDDAERFLQAALELDADHARSIAAVGMLLTYDKKFEQATALFEKALTIAPDDATVQLRFAEALLRHAVGPFAGATNLDGDSRPRFRRARELAIAAHDGQPSPLAEAIIGTSYLVEEDATAGVGPLERACAARPARHDFALNLYAVYLRSDRRADADRIFTSVFENARHPQTVLAARAIYVRESIIKTNRLIEADRLDEAVLHLGETIAATADPTTRADLIMQADKLARVVERNRQVRLYNEAVAALNRGDHTAALEHSERLLSFATDDDICAAAERIKTRARRRVGM